MEFGRRVLVEFGHKGKEVVEFGQRGKVIVEEEISRVMEIANVWLVKEGEEWRGFVWQNGSKQQKKRLSV